MQDYYVFGRSSMARQTYPPGTVLMRPMLDDLARNWWLILLRGRLVSQSHVAQNRVELPVGAEVVKCGIDLEPNHAGVVLCAGHVEPLESRVLIAQSGVDSRDWHGKAIAACGKAFKLG